MATPISCFSIQERPILLSVHSFIVRNNPNDLELESTNVVYQIKSPGGRTATDQIARDIALDLDRHIYLASPLVLHHQGIDIIPGADWMNQYEGICLLTS